MKPSDVKRHMMFSMVDITSYFFTVEEVVGEVAKGTTWGCFGPSHPAEEELKRLADPKIFRYLEKDTFDSMAREIDRLKDKVSWAERDKQKAEELRAATLAHHEPNTLALCAGDRRADILQQKLDDFRKQTQDDYFARKADLKRVWLYVDNAASGEYGYRDSEGHLCTQLLEKWGGGNASDPSTVRPRPYSEAKPMLEAGAKAVIASVANAFARGDLLLDSSGSAVAVRDLTVGGVDEVADPAKHTALGELTAVLWFLTTLALDHEPLCAIKQGGDAKCDCDKLIPDNDAWAKRVRAALQLPGKIHDELKEARDRAAHTAEAHSLEQKARLQAVATAMEHAKRLREYEAKLTPLVAEHDTPHRANYLDDAVVAYVSDLKRTVATQAEKLSRRRVIQAKPVAGASVPGGLGTVYEVEIEDEKRILVVVKGPLRGLPNEQYYRWAEEVQALLKKEFGSTIKTVVMDNGMELTLLELS